MLEFIVALIPVLVLLTQAFLVLLLVAVLARRSWGRRLYSYMGEHAFILGFLVSLGAMLGSLFFSEVMGYEPCPLCWAQRALLYPLIVVFGLGVWKKFNWVFPLAGVLALIALVIGGYQEFSSLTNLSVLSCTEEGGSCAKVFVKEFGYITIPVMSMTTSLAVLFIVWVNRLYKRDG